MTGPGDMKSATEAALWRRFRALERADANQEAPTALELAAYADGRLDESTVERIEAWLHGHREVLDDIIAARSGHELPAPHEVVERAAALVGSDPAGARIIPFRRPAAPSYGWRVHMARIAVAASLVLTGLIGFTLGTESYASLFGPAASVTGGLFDQSSGVFTSEDSAI